MTGKAVEKVKKPTTSLQVQIAMLDAWGYNATDTAKLLDCTREHVHAIRKKDWYLEEREKWVTGGITHLEGIMESLKVRSLGVHGEAMEMLREALVAEDADRNPLWSVRLKAIEIALNHKMIQAITGAINEGKSITAAVTQVVVNFVKDADGMPVLDPDWIEGEIDDATP